MWGQPARGGHVLFKVAVTLTLKSLRLRREAILCGEIERDIDHSAFAPWSHS